MWFLEIKFYSSVVIVNSMNFNICLLYCFLSSEIQGGLTVVNNYTHSPRYFSCYLCYSDLLTEPYCTKFNFMYCTKYTTVLYFIPINNKKKYVIVWVSYFFVYDVTYLETCCQSNSWVLFLKNAGLLTTSQVKVYCIRRCWLKFWITL